MKQHEDVPDGETSEDTQVFEISTIRFENRNSIVNI